MKIYVYNEWVQELVDSILIRMNEDQIIETYYPYWEKRMIKKYGAGHELITRENCIEDWVVVNWAWEEKENND